MGHYFFHLISDRERIEDGEGREIATLDLAVAEALGEARAMICHDALAGTIRLDWRIEVEDERGVSVHRLLFADAISVVGPDAGRR